MIQILNDNGKTTTGMSLKAKMCPSEKPGLSDKFRFLNKPQPQSVQETHLHQEYQFILTTPRLDREI